jgi:hypothetical protein
VHLDRDPILIETWQIEGVDELVVGLPHVERGNPALVGAVVMETVEKPAHLTLQLGQLVERFPANKC